MEPRSLVWLAVCVGLVLALSASAAVPGWVLGAVGAAALVLVIPLSARRIRAERNLARSLWRTLTTR